MDRRLNAGDPLRPDGPLKLDHPPNVDARLIMGGRLRVDHPRTADGLLIVADPSDRNNRHRKLNALRGQCSNGPRLNVRRDLRRHRLNA